MQAAPASTRARGTALPLPLVVTTALTVVAGWLFKAHCYLDGAWNGGEQ